ncbi:MAG TPA: flagellar hook-length control protein FliK [Burkholderiaceae bacterium]
MKPSPVINVANTAPASNPKPAGGSSSDQSFGQVLAQQVNAPSSSSTSQAGNTAQNTAPAGANGNTQSGSNASNGAADSTNGASAAGGKNVKSKHGQDDSGTAAGTDPNALAGSAQLLALVSNVQQAAASSASTTADTVSTVAANAASNAQAALANFQAAVATSAAAGKAAVQNAVADFSKDIKAALPDAEQDVQTMTVDTSKQDAMTAVDTNTAQTAASSSVDAQDAAPSQSAADLAANAQKDVQTDIANLAQAAVKSADTIRDAVATAAAAPAMLNNTQLNTVASQMVGASDKLTPQVGSPGWDQALGQKVVWMVAGGQQSASLTLNPPDLGPMQVVLNVTNSHATATFTAAQPEVRQALETALPKLREMLGDAGIQLGQASVNAGNAQQQQNFANQASPRSGNGGNGSSERGIDALDGTRGIVAQAASIVSSGIGLVDTFA